MEWQEWKFWYDQIVENLELEPEKDPPAENPWHDLWFYSNPVFITTK